MNDAVQEYIESIDPRSRPLFDRVHRLILAQCPGVAVTISYGMPTYRLGGHGVHVGVWKHGVSLYGWDGERAAAFLERHPDLHTGKGTIRLSFDAASRVTDDDLRTLIQAALPP